MADTSSSLDDIRNINDRLKFLDITLPSSPPKPLASYVPAKKVDHIVYTSGQLPLIDGQLSFEGKASDSTLEKATEAAGVCVINALAAIQGCIGDIENIEEVIKVVGFVNSEPDFTAQPQVLNGASDLLRDICGERGIHARSAVGVAALPLDSIVEVEMIVKVKNLEL